MNKKIFIAFLAIATLTLAIIILKFPPTTAHHKELQLIMDYYKPSPDYCGAAVTRDISNPHAGEGPMDIACLITGMRNIILLQMPQEEFEKVMQKIKVNAIDYLIPEEIILLKLLKEEIDSQIVHVLSTPIIKNKYSFTILYRESGRQNALLLRKFYTGETAGKNDYLLGLLLGYKPIDIEFFYKRSAFINYYYPERVPSKKISNWPQEIQNKFYNFENTIWPTSTAYEKYEDDKQQALHWLEKNEK